MGNRSIYLATIFLLASLAVGCNVAGGAPPTVREKQGAVKQGTRAEPNLDQGGLTPKPADHPYRRRLAMITRGKGSTLRPNLPSEVPANLGPYFSFAARHPQHLRSRSLAEVDQAVKLAREVGRDRRMKGKEASAAAVARLIKQALNIDFLLADIGKPPPKVVTTLIKEHRSYREFRLTVKDRHVGPFEALLLLPKGKGPFRTVIGLHGHGDSPQVFADRFLGRELARKRFAVVMPRFRAMEYTGAEQLTAYALATSGFSLMGLRVYEVMVVLDHVQRQKWQGGRPLGLLSHSGGAAVANLVIMLSPQICAHAYDYVSDYLDGWESQEGFHCETAPELHVHADVLAARQAHVEARRGLNLPYGFFKPGAGPAQRRAQLRNIVGILRGQLKGGATGQCGAR